MDQRKLRVRSTIGRAVGHAACLAFLGCLGALTGCMHVIAYDTPYFRDGPQQLRQPDGDLKTGTQVWITGQQDTYRRVLTLTGVHAYVWQGAIKTQSEWRDTQNREKEADKMRQQQAKQADERSKQQSGQKKETQKQTKPL